MFRNIRHTYIHTVCVIISISIFKFEKYESSSILRIEWKYYVKLGGHSHSEVLVCQCEDKIGEWGTSCIPMVLLFYQNSKGHVHFPWKKIYFGMINIFWWSQIDVDMIFAATPNQKKSNIVAYSCWPIILN